MNWTRFFLFLFFFSIYNSQIVVAQLNTFIKVYSGGSYEEGVKSFHLPNGSYRIVGNSASYGWGGTNIWVIALDSVANFMWHNIYSQPGIEQAEDAVMDKQGNMYIIGSSTSISQKGYQLTMLSIDASGQVLNQVYYGGDDWDFGYGISIVGDSALLMVGETYSYGNGKSDAWVIKSNLQGDSLWSATLGGKQRDLFYAVKSKLNDGFVCVGQSQNYGNGSFDPIICGFTDQGDSLWAQTVAEPMDGGFYSFDIDSDSSIVAVGYQTDTTNSFKDILFAKFTKDGLPIYNATWLRQGQKAYVRDVVSRNLNYFMTGISTAFSSGGEDFNTNHIDAQGFWKNGISNGDVKDDYPKSITIDTIGGLHFLVTGTTLGYGLAHSGILFIRYDSNLFCNTTPEITIPSSIKKSVDLDNLISVFPNPFTSYFLLRKSELLFDEHFTIEVFDINGVKIWSENWRKDQNELKINTTNWPASSYFIHIYNKQNNIGKVVFKLP